MRKYFRKPHKSKSFLFTRILFAYFMYSFLYFYFDFHVFCCWIFSPFVTPRLCVIFVHTLAFIGLVFYFFTEPDTNLFVYGHVEGLRREVWAAYVGCQSVYTAVLKPPTVNAWKCFFFGYEVLMMRLHISFCRLVSSRAKVTCHMRIVVGGDFVWFFFLCCCFASFFLFDIPRIRLKLCQVRLCHGYLNLQLKKFLVMDVMYDLALCKADVSAVWESQRWVI